MDTTIKPIVANPLNETLFIGCLFVKNDLFLEYDKVINSKYYFSQEFCRTIYDWLSVLHSREQAFTEKNLAMYVAQDNDRLDFYRGHGGWKPIQAYIDLVEEADDFKSYFKIIEKYALLRELEFKGVDTSKIIASKSFETDDANAVYAKVRRKIDSIHTKITGDVDLVDVGQQVSFMAENFLERPALGTLSFMETYNDLFRGFQLGSMMAFGLMSNYGKTRFLAKIAAYNALIKKEKTLLMLNEMTEAELRLAILTTVINNNEFRSLHGYKIDKIEKEIALGMYRDDNGNMIYRKCDPETSEYTESIKEYKDRIMMTSNEYREVQLVAKWIEETALDRYLSVINVSRDYTDLALETCIRKNVNKGFKFFAYDNLKSDKANIGDWSSLIKTTTTLSEMAKNEHIFVYGSIQLTPDTENYDPMDLNSMSIAASKGLKNVLDMLILGKEIKREQYRKYLYIPTTTVFGETSKKPIPLPEGDHDTRLQCHVVDKNRFGGKEPILVRINLNKNIWEELGIMVRA